mmetsp:Transcript_35493/g.93996  ORF Transcript_35493/g.93996 Transcript_35493/m.93996 type:complete len:96 (+) Transcript_35493:2-289(+)
MVVKFDWENMEERKLAKSPPMESRILGWVMFSYFLIMALTVLYIHVKHAAVFEERYQAVKPGLAQHADAVEVMSSRATPRRRPDNSLFGMMSGRG